MTTMNKTSGTGYELLMRFLGGNQEVGALMERLGADDQSQDLLINSILRLGKKLNISSQDEAALDRLVNMVRDGQHWDVALLRNNIFKIANLLGIKLPSKFASTKRAYLLPKMPGDPVVVLRMFVADGLRKKQVRLDPGVEGRFVKMEEVGMPSAALLDQMGLGAYDTPRYIVTFPQGPVYLTEADFQFKYVERPQRERNLLKGPTPGATLDEQKARREEILNLRRIDRLNPRYAQESDMSLHQQIQRIASQHPETRVHIVPILRKYADGGKSAAEGDELLGGRTWGNPDPHSMPDDNIPYNKHEDSPPAGTDGSAQRKKYNEWFRENVCPSHKTTCGAPWLAKSAGQDKWDEVLVGDKVRIRWAGYPQSHAVIEELPQKGKKYVKRYTFAIGAQNMSLHSDYFLLENLKDDWKPTASMTPDSAVAGLKKAIEKAFKDWEDDIEKGKSRTKEIPDWFRKALTGQWMPEVEDVFYLNVEPRDYAPVEVHSKDNFYLKAEWTNFDITLNHGHTDDELEEMGSGGDPHYTKLVSKSPGGARQFFKWCKVNQDRLKSMSGDDLRKVLDQGKIGYDYRFSVWH